MSEKELQMIEDFIETKRSAEEQMVIDFAIAILDCELQKKRISEDISDIKKEAKANGAQVNNIMKALKELKDELKIDDLNKRENSNILSIIGENSDVKFKIHQLIAK
jgi:uncharacterized protein (UPF0335 family)